MREIKTVTIVGANGSMGAASAGIVASFGNTKVYMLARSLDKSNAGIAKAIKSIRSSTIKNRLIPGTIDDDMEKAISESDWVFETAAETYEVKEELNTKISKYRKPGTLVSTISSGLSIERLAKLFDADGQKHYYGTHFFNPPYKLVLCELITHKGNDPEYTKQLGNYLDKTLRRAVVYTNDTPAFAGNRIGFQFINEIAIFADKYKEQGGIALMDEIMGGYTGRSLAPLATLDFVGLDVHKAIVDNLYEMAKHDHARSTFALPEYIQKLIGAGSLGAKKGQGLYKRVVLPDGKKERHVYNITTGEYSLTPRFNIPFIKKARERIALSDYRGAMSVIKSAEGLESELCRYFIARYISYSLSIVGEVVDTKENCDIAMGTGFNWVPASAFVDFLGGVDETKRFLEKSKIPIPAILDKSPNNEKFYKLQYMLDARSLFKA